MGKLVDIRSNKLGKQTKGGISIGVVVRLLNNFLNNSEIVYARWIRCVDSIGDGPIRE